MSVLLGSSYHPEGCWLMPPTLPRCGRSQSHATTCVPQQTSGVASEVAALVLFALDRLEEGLEVALAEAQRAVPLDELEEDGRPVAERLGEDLQQVAVLVAVDEDLALLQLLDRHAYVADALTQLGVLVVAVGRVEELDAVGPQRVHGGQDVVGRDGQVLGTGAPVELEVLVDLALLLGDGRLVERELDPVVAVRDDLAHQGGV